MSNKYLYYCPMCGAHLTQEMTICYGCNKQVAPERSEFEGEYYAQIAENKLGSRAKMFEILDEEIASKLHINENERINREISKLAAADLAKQRAATTSVVASNLPKCPTCSSTNIKPVSGLKRGLHGYLFGIFSATSLAQFECKDCGYKW